MQEDWRLQRPADFGGSDIEWLTRCELAALYRAAVIYGWSDLLSTHITARIQGSEALLINPYGLLFEEITASNLVKIDLDGNVLDGSGATINPAGYVIHGCVHAARPDVACAIHSHTRDGTAVATQRDGLLPVTQHALIIFDDIAYHDFEGPALDLGEQSRLVRDLGTKHLLFLRNHGTLIAGSSIAHAFILMYRLERACKMQISAQSGGASLFPIGPAVIDKSMAIATTLFTQGALSKDGEKEWRAVIRRLGLMELMYAQ